MEVNFELNPFSVGNVVAYICEQNLTFQERNRDRETRVYIFC